MGLRLEFRTLGPGFTTNPVDRGFGATNTYDLKQDYGPSTINTPQILVLSYVYQEPFFRDQHGLGWVLGGWELSGIVNFQTGQSITVTQSADPIARQRKPGNRFSARGRNEPGQSKRQPEWAENPSTNSLIPARFHNQWERSAVRVQER